VFGLRPRWRDSIAVGLAFPDTDAEIVLHRNPAIPFDVEVHYRCAVVRDPFGTTLCILDLSKGRRQQGDVDAVG
jgi:hypothetical protein